MHVPTSCPADAKPVRGSLGAPLRVLIARLARRRDSLLFFHSSSLSVASSLYLCSGGASRSPEKAGQLLLSDTRLSPWRTGRETKTEAKEKGGGGGWRDRDGNSSVYRGFVLCAFQRGGTFARRSGVFALSLRSSRVCTQSQDMFRLSRLLASSLSSFVRLFSVGFVFVERGTALLSQNAPRSIGSSGDPQTFHRAASFLRLFFPSPSVSASFRHIWSLSSPFHLCRVTPRQDRSSPPALVFLASLVFFVSFLRCPFRSSCFFSSWFVSCFLHSTTLSLWDSLSDVTFSQVLQVAVFCVAHSLPSCPSPSAVFTLYGSSVALLCFFVSSTLVIVGVCRFFCLSCFLPGTAASYLTSAEGDMAHRQVRLSCHPV